MTTSDIHSQKNVGSSLTCRRHQPQAWQEGAGTSTYLLTPYLAPEGRRAGIRITNTIAVVKFLELFQKCADHTSKNEPFVLTYELSLAGPELGGSLTDVVVRET